MKKHWWIIIVGIILIGIIIIFLIKKERKPNVFEFPQTIVVKNFTKYNYADTLSMIVVNKIFKLDTIDIRIYYMPAKIGNDDFQVTGYLIKNLFQKHSYLLYVHKELQYPIQDLISHEMVHLKQMEDGDLAPIFGDETRMIYKGDTIDYQTPYEKRGFEIEAYDNQTTISRNIDKLLYSK